MEKRSLILVNFAFSSANMATVGVCEVGTIERNPRRILRCIKYAAFEKESYL
jgi:hypothetical protein